MGLLHGFAPFVGMFQIWIYTTASKGKYACNSKVHSALDLLSNLLLVFAAMAISPTRGVYEAADETGQADVDALAFVIYPIIFALVLWLLRFAELALCSPRESVRRENAEELGVGVMVLCMWVGTAVLPSRGKDRVDAQHAAQADAAAALLWCGNLCWTVSRALSPLLSMLRPSTLVPVERSLVCPHHGYKYERTNEFMFLMLGEAVLQIVIAAGPRSQARPEDREYWMLYTRITAMGSFVLATAMMHTFQTVVKEQLEGRHEMNAIMGEREAEEAKILSEIEKDSSIVARRRGSFSNTAEQKSSYSRRQELIKQMNTRQEHAMAVEDRAQITIRVWLALSSTELFLWQLNAITVLLVGAALKLAVSNPLEWAPGRFGMEQRYALGGPVACTFAIQLFYQIVVKHWRDYRSLRQLRQVPGHSCVVACRLLLVACSIAVCSIELWPLAHVWMQAFIAVAQVLLVHLQKHVFPITSQRHHPIEEAFDALRLKALRHRNRASLSDLSQADQRLSRMRRFSEEPDKQSSRRESEPSHRASRVRPSECGRRSSATSWSMEPDGTLSATTMNRKSAVAGRRATGRRSHELAERGSNLQALWMRHSKEEEHTESKAKEGTRGARPPVDVLGDARLRDCTVPDFTG